MRKNLLLFVCAFATLMLFTTACKKDAKTPQEKILGKWNLNTIEWKETWQGDTDDGIQDRSTSGDYFEFRKDGMVYLQFLGDKDTISYQVLSAQQIKLDGQTLELNTLSEKDLTIYSKYTEPEYVYESWYKFKK